MQKNKTEDLVKKAKSKDPDAFSQLMQLYKKDMYRVALAILMNDEDTADAIQDTMLTCWEKIHNLRQIEYFKTWMIKILISKCSHKFRDNRDMFIEPEKFAKMEGFVEKRNYMLPDDKLNNEEEKKILLSLVDQLKPKQKEVLLLQYFEQLSIKEMADVLEIPEGTVKTRIMYAKDQLKQLVDEYEKKEGRSL